MPAARKSNDRHAEEGTVRTRHQDGAAGTRLLQVPPAPKALGTVGKAEWRRLSAVLIDLETLTAADLRALQLLCEVLETAAECRETIVAQGMATGTAVGGLKPHPAIRTLEKARDQAARLLDSFGLTPKGRNAVDKAPEAAGRSRLSGLLDD